MWILYGINRSRQQVPIAKFDTFGLGVTYAKNSIIYGTETKGLQFVYWSLLNGYCDYAVIKDNTLELPINPSLPF